MDGEMNTHTNKQEPVRVRLLGGFSVRVGGRTVERDEWCLRKAAALVKLLALNPEHRLHREWIMDRLWPDLGPKAASNNLRISSELVLSEHTVRQHVTNILKKLGLHSRDQVASRLPDLGRYPLSNYSW